VRARSFAVAVGNVVEDDRAAAQWAKRVVVNGTGLLGPTQQHRRKKEGREGECRPLVAAVGAVAVVEALALKLDDVTLLQRAQGRVANQLDLAEEATAQEIVKASSSTRLSLAGWASELQHIPTPSPRHEPLRAMHTPQCAWIG